MKNDSDFLNALEASQPAVKLVHDWLAANAFDVRIKPHEIRPDFNQRHNYADDGDIEVIQRIEVKNLSRDWTGADDFPFNPMIVDEVYKVERKPLATLWGYVNLNRSKTAVAIIRSYTAPHWIVKSTYDQADGQERTFYYCPTELAKFYKL